MDATIEPQEAAKLRGEVEQGRELIRWMAQTVHQAYHETGTFETCTKSVCKAASDHLRGALHPELQPKRSDPNCTGPGTCHGPLRWCNDCGDVKSVCDFTACDIHKCSCGPGPTDPDCRVHG